MKSLCLSLTLLDGRFHGRGDGDEPEWPPSPWRLFQALLAAAHTGCHHREWTEAHAQAFHWLEQRDPPMVVAPKARPLNGYRIFVPNNDTDFLAKAWAGGRASPKTPAELRTAKTVRPTGSAADQALTIHYLYPLTDQEESAPAVKALRQIARCLHTLGWGIDAATASTSVLSAGQVRGLPGIRWRHQDRGAPDSAYRRVPRPGSLDDLIESHNQFAGSISGRSYRPPRRPSAFNRVAYLPETAILRRPYAAFLLRGTEDSEVWRPFPQQDANVVAAMLRSVACHSAQRDSHEFPGGSDVYVAGHTGNRQDSPPRFSYLALPTVAHPHADGMIRRVLITEPHGGDGSHADWAAHRLRGQSLSDNTGHPVAVLEASHGREPVIRRYVQDGTTWSSVTPVILPGHDDFRSLKPHEAANMTKAERLLLKAIDQAGISVEAVSDITLCKAPFWPGALHPREYRRPDYLQGLSAWHVSLKFREPVAGPLAIGAGRHCGLGVLAAEGETIS